MDFFLSKVFVRIYLCDDAVDLNLRFREKQDRLPRHMLLRFHFESMVRMHRIVRQFSLREMLCL